VLTAWHGDALWLRMKAGRGNEHRLTPRRRVIHVAADPSLETKHVHKRIQRLDRALALLAGAEPRGCTEDAMRTHGFTRVTLGALVKAGLATATAHRMTAGDRTIDVTWMRITDEGWRALPESASEPRPCARPREGPL
jgi:hypothetical protein